MTQLLLERLSVGNNLRMRRACAVMALAALGWASGALAQVVPPPGGGVPQGVPQGSPLPRVLPPTPPEVGRPLPPLRPAAPSGAVPAGTVAVKEVAVDGVTAYPPAKVQALVAGLVGPDVTLAAIEAARLALLNLYRSDLYVLTSVNARLDSAGRLRFTVIEGRIAEVKLDGDIGPAGTQVLRLLHHLTEEVPIDSATLERWLLLAQDVPGVALHAVLRPSADAPGALTLVAQVTRSAVSGLVTLDNRGYSLTGPDEFLAVLDLNSFTEFGEKTEVSLYKTSGGTETFAQLTEEVYVGGSGLRVRAYGGDGWSTPSGDLRAVGYHGYTEAYGLAALYPLIRSRAQTLNLGAYFDIEANTVKTDAGDGELLTASNDSLRILRFGADYALQDLWLGGDRSAINTASFRVSQGVPALGGTSDANPLPGRVGENVGFTKITAAASRTQTLFTPWQDASVALRGFVTGQYSGDVLPPAEEFYLGGADFTRGYYSGEVTGDSALAATAELQLNTALTLNVFSYPAIIGAQFYAFYDWGETWESQRTDANHTLRSVGGGVRLNLTRYAELDIEGVARVTRYPQGNQGGIVALDADGVYWRLLARF
jgi:hemolysin activation/secretion protein